MGKTRPIQKSFASGEITPRLRSRPDLKFYNQGVEELSNFLTTPFGTITKRNGTKYIDEISDTLIYGRLFTFRIEESNTFVIVVTEDFITIYNKNTAELVAGANLVLNPSFDNNGDDWNTLIQKASPSIVIQTDPSIAFTGGACTVNSGNAAHIDIDFQFPDGDVTQTVSINASDARLSQNLTAAIPANIHSLELEVLSFFAAGQVTDFLSIGTTEGASDIPFVVDPLNSSKITFTPGVASFWISYKLEWDDSPNPSIAGIIGEGGNIGDPASIILDSITVLDTVVAGGEEVVSFVSPYSEQQVRELQVEKAPGQSLMYFAVRAIFTTKKLILDTITGIWTFEDVTFVGGIGDPPDEWDLTGYPGCITFYQGRLWLAGTAGHPVTVWGSVAGEDNYEDFTISAAAADDALELPMSRDGVIQWIQSGKVLHIGTDDSEHAISGTNNEELLEPSNARTFQQSSYGSTRIHAKWLSDKISFISNDRNRI